MGITGSFECVSIRSVDPPVIDASTPTQEVIQIFGTKSGNNFSRSYRQRFANSKITGGD